MHVVIIQPPLVQLNSPYPSGAYLASFFRTFSKLPEGSSIESVVWKDFSIELFHRIFSPEGLELIFSSSEQRALSLAQQADIDGDEETAFNLYRYISSSSAWILWINTIKSVLGSSSFSSRELAHEFMFSPFAPRGKRMDDYLSGLEGEAGADDAFFLCSLALADLADYITAVFDPHFSLVRYAESLAASEKDFSVLTEKLNGPVMTQFFMPLVKDFCTELRTRLNSSFLSDTGSPSILFCISVPFAGTFTGALSCAKVLKKEFGSLALIAFGGGYINTELREVTEPALFNFCDFLSYDRGYGSYYDIFRKGCVLDGQNLYKIRYCVKENTDKTRNIVQDVLEHGKIISQDDELCETSPEYEKIRAFENEMTISIFPDYEGIDFSRYPRLADDKNPMHRIWSDGSWLKAYLAHGCYWHRCAFCDVTLDYVKAYKKISASSVHKHLLSQAQKTGVYGVHFVDEASPPVSLREFALENLAVPAGSQRLSFWGNIRFEKSFTPDLALLLARGGLTAVSGGIEIAAEDGLNAVNKGTDIASLVKVCAAFKEAGILVHAYMIYGFFGETPQQLINSMETLRQLFAEGLLDSAFWHKFVLTKHSKIFSEWKQGKHSLLKPIGWGKPVDNSWFAHNDLRFEGETKSEKYGLVLDSALDAWMHGEDLQQPVQSWFSFPMPAPQVGSKFIQNQLISYEKGRNKAQNDYSDFIKSENQYLWLGGKPWISEQKNKKKSACTIQWIYMGGLMSVDVDITDKIERETLTVIVENLWKMRAETANSASSMVQNSDENRWKKTPLMHRLYPALRSSGIIRF
ncbi:MAG TPA: radical SAM protein [Treponemataceae bacterium]|nr:radical SAM protein [Treponemataceae bacterium]